MGGKHLWLAFFNLWSGHDINLSLVGRVYNTTMGLALFYGPSEFRTSIVRLRLTPADYVVWWEQRISNYEVCSRVWYDRLLVGEGPYCKTTSDGLAMY